MWLVERYRGAQHCIAQLKYISRGVYKAIQTSRNSYPTTAYTNVLYRHPFCKSCR